MNLANLSISTTIINEDKLKIWLKLIIVGIILFFAGAVYITAMGGFGTGSEGMIISVIGGILVAVGALSGMKRGFNRMMGE